MNYHNLAQKTNYIAGSNKFTHIPFFLTNVNIPGINFSSPEIGGKSSVRMKLPSDTYSFNNLSIEMLIDEDFRIYKEFTDLLRKHIRLDGTFSDFYFDFWIELSNNKGNKVMKLDFTNCRFESISDIVLDSQDEVTEHTMTIDISFDYFDVERDQHYIIRPIVDPVPVI